MIVSQCEGYTPYGTQTLRTWFEQEISHTTVRVFLAVDNAHSVVRDRWYPSKTPGNNATTISRLRLVSHIGPTNRPIDVWRTKPVCRRRRTTRNGNGAREYTSTKTFHRYDWRSPVIASRIVLQAR